MGIYDSVWPHCAPQSAQRMPPGIREVSFMDFNKIKAIGLEYAEKGKNAAMDSM